MANPKIATLFPAAADIPAAYRLNTPIVQREYLLDGQILTWNGPLRDAVSPLWGKGEAGPVPTVIGKFPALGQPEALAALAAAVKAYDSGRGPWPTMPVEQRIRCVADFATRMKAKREEVVNLLMWEIGKSHADSCKEFDRTIEYIQDTIDALKNLDRVSSRFEIQQGIIAQIRRAPLGVVLCMGPFNYPLNETFTTLIPAIIMGNTVVFKPPKFGVLIYRPLLEAFRDCFPKGVVNTVYGEGKEIISPLMSSGKIDVLAFIGTSKVADILKKQHPTPHRLRCVLGLDAKNPAIILPDADIELAVKECLLGSLSFNGQRCTALKLIFVHQSIADAFLKRLSESVEKLNPGMPWEAGVGVTPLPEANKPQTLAAMVKDATDKGAAVVNPSGGQTNGSFYFPAIVYPVSMGMRLYTEEQFGPVIPVIPFTDVAEPIECVINSNYGQQLSVFGKDPDVLARLIDPLVNQVCRVNINCQCQRGPDVYPFTGRKDSAEGTLSVSDALRVFTIRTLVATKDSDDNKRIISTIARERLSNFLSTDFIL